uniref:Homeobox domain-containing protein n=1 Tax=Strigamia maritima TaxID=126957 RepID=T1JAI7_STRMM
MLTLLGIGCRTKVNPNHMSFGMFMRSAIRLEVQLISLLCGLHFVRFSSMQPLFAFSPTPNDLMYYQSAYGYSYDSRTPPNYTIPRANWMCDYDYRNLNYPALPPNQHVHHVQQSIHPINLTPTTYPLNFNSKPMQLERTPLFKINNILGNEELKENQSNQNVPEEFHQHTINEPDSKNIEYYSGNSMWPKLTKDNRSSDDRNIAKNYQSVANKTIKSRRIRTTFSQEQIEKLEGKFKQQQYFTGPERKLFANSIELNDMQVKVWFQNRRMKWRKENVEIKKLLSSNSKTESDQFDKFLKAVITSE